MGITLSAHVEETFVGETDTERMTLRLMKRRGRFEPHDSLARYRFEVVHREEILDDDDALSSDLTDSWSASTEEVEPGGVVA